MDKLSKENYWNEMQAKYPEAVQIFCDWIDKYKEKVGWASLFQDGIKFHDLPFEFQNGIIARFDIECFYGIRTGRGSEFYERNRVEYVHGITKLFEDLQQQLNKEKQ